MERHEIVTGPRDLYLTYACGPNFRLEGAYCRLEIARYGEQEFKNEVGDRFREFYNMPLRLEG